jgi:6-phosphogluconolactonase
LTANDSPCSVLIFKNNKKMTDFMVDRWKILSEDSFRKRGLFVAALSGGNTPRDFYSHLALPGDHGIWKRTHIFVVDERYVPSTNADSNYGMLSRLLLDRVPVPAENRHPVPVQERTLEKAAGKYEEEIRQFFELREGVFPQFDLIMLGIGEDGHTASLFPGHDALEGKKHFVSAVKEAPKKHQRVTLTLPVINNARNIIFLVAGKEKADAVKEVMEEKNPSLPASMVRPIKGNLSFVLDREAASLLSPEFRRECSMVTQ